ncbi:MAG: hypothetical protein Fur0016_00560 [Anaerolineales bacterium]
MPPRRIPLSFQVGPTPEAARLPETFISAEVPGAVQLDWARAQGWPPVEYLRNEPGQPPHFNAQGGIVLARDYAWMEHSFWLYRTALDFPPLAPDERLFLVCGGVDYQSEIRLDGHTLHAQEGMFTPIELDLTETARPGSRLEILVHPAPQWEISQPVKVVTFAKPLVSYGWDFHPRLVPLGIWRETYLEIRPACHLRSAETLYRLSDDLRRAEITLDVELSQPGDGFIRWTLFDPRGQPVLRQEAPSDSARLTLKAALDQPELWWPNGCGPAALYVSRVELLDEREQVRGQRESRIGFRRIRLTTYPGQWEDPALEVFPKSRHKPPLTLEVNGQAVFGKGSNLVSPDIFPGRLNAESYRPLLDLAKESHFNLIRVWGGAVTPPDEFYDLCDEHGLMVWQEFPLACARYENDPHYLKILDQESRSIIRRLRHRASLTLWCGGNELFNNWSRMTDQDLALRLLHRNCFDLDPGRPFWPTSPLCGWAHGGYTFKLEDGREVFQYFAEARYMAYTEFGVPGLIDSETICRLIPPDELFPPRPGTHWEVRHGFDAWGKDAWLQLNRQELYFGPAESLEQMVAQGQWLQAEGLRFVFEEARRQKPVCSLALNWCFNEPWPAAVNGSLVSWPARPKPALQAVAAALRPALLSARVPKFSWRPGETFRAELFLLNDSFDDLPAGKAQATLVFGENEFLMGAWQHPGAPAAQNQPGPVLEFTLPALTFDRFSLVLRDPARPQWETTYTFHFQP